MLITYSCELRPSCAHTSIHSVLVPTATGMAPLEPLTNPVPTLVHGPVEAAVASGTMIEINASPDRRDMNDVHARAAAAAGIPIPINCDAHRVGGFEVARYGVATARRAWLSAAAVPNTRQWSELAELRPRARTPA